MSAADEVQDKALRDGIDELLPLLNEAQLKGLHRIHDRAPWGGLANCPPEKLAETYDLIHRTLYG